MVDFGGIRFAVRAIFRKFAPATAVARLAGLRIGGGRRSFRTGRVATVAALAVTTFTYRMRHLIIFITLLLAAQVMPVRADDGRDGYCATADTIVTDSTLCDTLCVPASLPWPQNVQERIGELLDSRMFETSQVGMMVYDLTADSAIFCRGERLMLRPASTMKVLTAVSAIDRLGGSYQFRTSLCYTGTVNSGTLTGDVWCVGGFDPLFDGDDMKAFAESLRQIGVDTIRGRIVADKTMKDSGRLGEGWCWDDDNPTLSPLLISRKDVFVERLVCELREAGVTVDAFCAEGALPDGAYVVCTRFHTIDQVLLGMMKDSDNLSAEAMFYQLAADGGNHPAEASHARTAIRRTIGKTGLDGREYKIADGSGLSLYNYVSAELEVLLLRYAYLNTDIYMHLLPALPVAGEDGTLKSRMRGTPAESNVRAKTGTLTGISSLAGYCTAANGHQLCFAIINQGVMHGRSGRAFQDRVCSVLCEP